MPRFHTCILILVLGATPAHAQPADELSPEDQALLDAANKAAEDQEAADAGETQGGEIIEVTGSARHLPPPAAGSSDFVRGRDVLNAAPHEAGDVGGMLETGPGLYVTRKEGDAVAHSIFLRGFDADHGQDIEMRVGGIPVNQRSHIHGQGYADLGFVIPEVVRSVRVTEGVYDPRQGDFATAGSISFDLGLEKPGTIASATAGSFGERRYLLAWAPKKHAEDTFAAIAVHQTNGFGENRGGRSASAMFQFDLSTHDTDILLQGGFYGARANLAGALRLDDIASGDVGYYDSYDVPTATAQSALAGRAQVGLSLERSEDDGSKTAAQVYLTWNAFRLRSNETGFIELSEMRPEFHGRGDLIEQGNRDWTLGARVSQRSRTRELTKNIRGFVETGIDGQLDLVDQIQNLIAAPANQTWDQRVDASIAEASVGGYLALSAWFTDRLRFRGGVRADALYFDVNDRFGNAIPRFNRDVYIVGFRRTAFGVANGPRGTLEWEPRPDRTVMLSYGEGYRSPQARQLEEGETAPYSKVKAAELGVRLGNELGDLRLTAAAFYTHLSLDLAFDPLSSTLERIGPTTRMGGVIDLFVRPQPWMLLSLSATAVRATLDAPPPPTSEVPDPPYQPGQLLPYVPPVVVRADYSAHTDVGTIRGAPVTFGIGLGIEAMSPRPLPYGVRGEPVFLADGSLSLKWKNVDLTLAGLNLTDDHYAAVDLNHVSSWDPDEVPSRIPARHIVAGPPLTILLTLGVQL